MGIERIVHKTGNFARKAVAGGLFGLLFIGAGTMPANGQQNVKYAPNPVRYIPCASSENKDKNIGKLLVLLGLMAGTSNPDAQKLGGIVSTLGTMEHQKEVAREGRAQVNINQGEQKEEARYAPAPGCVWANPEDPNDITVTERLGVGFAANYWKDFNKKDLDKAIRGKRNINEFAKIKDKFYDNERIFLAIYNREMKGKTRLEIYDPKKNKLHEASWNCGDLFKAPCSLLTFGSDFDFTSWLVKNGGYGSYVAVWSSSKGMSEMTKFEVLPASERPEKKQ